MSTESPEAVKKLYFLKSRFQSESKGVYGLFYVLFDPSTNHYEKIDVLASYFKSFVDDLVSAENLDSCQWSTMVDLIDEAKYKGEYAEGLTKDIIFAMEQVFRTADIEIIVPMVVKKEKDSLKIKFEQIFKKAFPDDAVTFQFGFDELTDEELQLREATKKEIYEKEQENLDEKKATFEEKKKQLPTEGALIDINFVLSPVKGRPISDLKVGDIIMVRIPLDNPKGRYFADLLDVISDEKVMPIPATVQNIQVGPTGETFILTKIQDGVFGRVSETESVKLRHFDPEKDEALKGVEVPNTEKKTLDAKIDYSRTMPEKEKLNIIILLIALAVLILFALIYFIVL